MNLIIDIGNSCTKLALYNGEEKISVSRIYDYQYNKIKKEISGLNISNAIISSVKILPDNLHKFLLKKIPGLHILSHKLKIPFRIEYSSPETLGSDRIAAVAGAYNLYPESAILIIDAGTAITYDYLIDNTYKGGNISPGLEMRLKALNKFTKKLPLVSLEKNYSSPGNNTTNSILAGVVTGVAYEINEYIRTFANEHMNCKIIMTGGDCDFLKDKIAYQSKYIIPDLVIDGLNYILNYNAK